MQVLMAPIRVPVCSSADEKVKALNYGATISPTFCALMIPGYKIAIFRVILQVSHRNV
jgi:hypothetical protein